MAITLLLQNRLFFLHFSPLHPTHHSHCPPPHPLRLHPCLLSGRCVWGSAFCCWTTDCICCTPSWALSHGAPLRPSNRYTKGCYTKERGKWKQYRKVNYRYLKEGERRKHIFRLNFPISVADKNVYFSKCKVIVNYKTIIFYKINTNTGDSLR